MGRVEERESLIRTCYMSKESTFYKKEKYGGKGHPNYLSNL